MLQWILIGAAAVAALVVGVFLFSMQGPDLSQYEYLIDPHITTMADQPMLVVEAVGDPNQIGAKAFKLLFEAYYKLEKAPKGPKQPAPRARWLLSADVPAEQWIGRYGLPVPDYVTALPDVQVEPGLRLELVTWEYGDVAEILHIGPYNKEEPTINRLKVAIEKLGYQIVGEHEEEYLRGPGMFFGDNPEQYYTIIRYRVRKAADS